MKGALSIILILLIFQVEAQQLWTGPTLKLELNEKFSTELEQQVRLQASELSYLNSFTEGGLAYKWFPSLSTKVNYRIIYSDFQDIRHRVSGDLLIKKKFKGSDFNFSFRTRYQRGFNRLADDPAKNYVRQLAEIEYEITSKAKPFTAFEIFYRFDQKNEVRFLRYTFGIEIETIKGIGTQLFYRFEKELNVKHPQDFNIFGLMLVYKMELAKQDD